jgi:hypothetical protein
MLSSDGVIGGEGEDADVDSLAMPCLRGRP